MLAALSEFTRSNIHAVEHSLASTVSFVMDEVMFGHWAATDGKFKAKKGTETLLLRIKLSTRAKLAGVFIINSDRCF